METQTPPAKQMVILVSKNFIVPVSRQVRTNVVYWLDYYQIHYPSSYIIIIRGYLKTDISGIYQASLFHLILISLIFIHIWFMPIFIVFDM